MKRLHEDQEEDNKTRSGFHVDTSDRTGRKLFVLVCACFLRNAVCCCASALLIDSMRGTASAAEHSTKCCFQPRSAPAALLW